MTIDATPDKRIERDLLGEGELHRDALFGIRTQRTLENLSFSGREVRDFPVFVRALAQVKKAAAIVNGQCGTLPPDIEQAIISAADDVMAGRHAAEFVADPFAGGGGIAVNVNMNEVLANLASERLGGVRGTYAPVDPKLHVNASQSTADACHTASKLALIISWRDLDRELERFAQAAERHATQLKGVDVIARTCLQDAMVTSLGDFFGGVAELVSRRREELANSVDKLRAVNLGGTVIGSGEGASDDYRRRIIDVLREASGTQVFHSRNLFDNAQNIDAFASVSASLGVMAMAFIKVAKDLRLMSSGPSAGFGEISLPAVQEGSSFFKGKINPVLPETLIQCSFLVLGNGEVARRALEHGELNLNVFEGAAAFSILDSFRMLTDVLTLFVDRCFAGIKASEKRSAAYEETLSRLRHPQQNYLDQEKERR